MNRFFARALPVLMAVLLVLALSPGARAQWDTDRGTPSKEPASTKPAERSSDPLPHLDRPEDVFGPAGRPKGEADEGEGGGWSIVLVVFRGPDRADLAKLGLAKVQIEGGLPNAYIERRGESTAIAVGHFSAGDAPEAVAELKRIQEMEVGGVGERPYRYALLAPPVNKSDPGSIPQYNLTQAHVLYGDQALYTLQVAVYGRRDLVRPTEKDLKEARAAAEQAAVKLRQEGEMAFYYHGPRMSMVTVGVFDSTDFDPEVASFKSPRLKDAIRRHPNNLYNGAGIQERRKGEKEPRLQSSQLVAIPQK